MLEQRIAALTSTLETRERPAAGDNSEQLEGAVRALSDRLDRIPVGNDNASAFAHLEQRVSLSARTPGDLRPDPGAGNLGRVEEGLQDILRHLERQHAESGRARREQHAQRAAPQPMDSGIVDMVKRELSDIRFSQSETDRHTQDSLEIVHNTLGHVVDRLAMIEGDLRAVRSAPAAPAAPVSAARPMPPSRSPRRRPCAPQPQPVPPQPKPELPNPARRAGSISPPRPREFHAAHRRPRAPPMPPRAISEILEPHAAPPRAAIEPDLPPDHPLEPGTRPAGRAASPSERIAASESAISEISAARRRARQLIELHRRRPPRRAGRRRRSRVNEKAAPRRKAAQAKASASRQGDGKEPSTITSKIRSLLVGASVVVIVLGTFKMAMTLLDTGSAPSNAGDGKFQRAAAPAQPPADASRQAGNAGAGAAPSMTSPTPIGRQSQQHSAPNTLDSAQVAIPQARGTARPRRSPRRYHRHDPERAASAPATGKLATGAGPAGRNDCPTASAARCCAPPR